MNDVKVAQFKYNSVFAVRFFTFIMVWSLPDIGGPDLSVSCFCSFFIPFILSCSFSFLLTFYFCRSWLAPYPLYSELAFLSICFRAPKTVCNQAFLPRAAERARKDVRDRQPLQGALLGVIVEEGLHCLTLNQSMFDGQRREGRTRKGHKFVFRVQNLDETHLKILQETMRLIFFII